MRFVFNLPAWLQSLIVGLAAYLKGEADQAKADSAEQQAASQAATKTVEDAAREVGALSDDEVQQELGQWRNSSSR